MAQIPADLPVIRALVNTFYHELAHLTSLTRIGERRHSLLTAARARLGLAVDALDTLIADYPKEH